MMIAKIGQNNPVINKIIDARIKSTTRFKMLNNQRPWKLMFCKNQDSFIEPSGIFLDKSS